MMESGTQNPEIQSTVSQPDASRQQRNIVIGIAIAVLVLLVVIVLAVIFLLQPSTPTAKIRDVFIIFMALESLLLGLALVILIIQIARLTNLLENEIKPILQSTNETISTLRGTTTFLSDNLTEPVIKLNEYMAGMSQMLKLIGLARGRTTKSNSQGE
jgi:hypothetical protein